MNMNKLLGALFAGLVVMIILPGCATMIRGTSETLMVVSEPSGGLVEVSSGQKGTTPCHFRLKRNQSVLLKISLEGYHTETVTVYPTLAGAGVILGGIIDYGTGAVYNLTPNPVHVMFKPLEIRKETTRKEIPPAKATIKTAPEKPKPIPTETPKAALPKSEDEDTD